MTDENNEEDVQVIDSGHVYLLMKKGCRISRNIRASWYFRHINGTIKELGDHGQHEDGIQVLAVTPAENSQLRDPHKKHVYRVLPSSTLTFISESYRLVFLLDLSPSILAVDHRSPQLLVEEFHNTLATTAAALVEPFSPPGSSVSLVPDLFVTVIAHVPLVHCKANQVLVQGFHLTSGSIGEFLHITRTQLDKVEKFAAESFSDMFSKPGLEDKDHHLLTGGIFTDIIERPETPDPQMHMINPDMTFINMLRYGILAVQLLPENSSAELIVVTDGQICLPETSLFESLMTQLRSCTISCSFIKVGSPFHYNSGFGQVAYTELMQFIATATFGAYLAQLPAEAGSKSGEMNMYHKALLTWSFQRGLEGFKIDNFSGQAYEDLTDTLAQTNRLPGSIKCNKQMWITPLMRKKHLDKTLATSLSHVISLRLREGYTIKDITISKGNQLEVDMVLPWRESVRIAYKTTSSWPMTTSKKQTHVEITIEGNYEFLHDITFTTKQMSKSPFRTALVKKYWQTLQSLSETDRLLLHLQSFSSNPVYYNVPGVIKNGIPLFYMPPNVNQPDISMQLNHSIKDAAFSQFASFWKPVLMLDTNIWQKWMHCHRIGLILEHDTPLDHDSLPGKYVHIPNSSGRFYSIGCRQAFTALCVFLRGWSTFVLMDNQSYIKLLFSEADQPPTSFLLIRLAGKSPCITLRLAFLGGTPSSVRNEVVGDLKDKILSLNFPPRGTQKEDEPGKKLTRTTSVCDKDIVKEWKPPLQRLWSEILCCVATMKPVEKILIRYDKTPKDFLRLDCGQYSSLHNMPSPSANQLAFNTYHALSKYLWHQRWVWDVQYGAAMPISMQALGKILSTLTKIRLQEGFHFGYASHGITNLVLEVEMKQSIPVAVEQTTDAESDEPRGERSHVENTHCVLQYIIFPPHTKFVREGLSEDEDEGGETTEADRELQVITECWVEPQQGYVCNSTQEHTYFDNHCGQELPQALFQVDVDCVSSMITFEHLNLMCQSTSVPAPQPGGCPLSARVDSLSDGAASNIQQVSFPFDIMLLVSRCQQVEMLFYTFLQAKETTENPEGSVPAEQNQMRGPNLVANQDPNAILYAQIVQQLEDLHERSLHLSDRECKNFMKLVQARERDEEVHPLPFVQYKETPELNRQVSNTSHASCLSQQSSFAMPSELHSGTVSQRSSMSQLPLRMNSEDSMAYHMALEKEAQLKETSGDKSSDIYSQRSGFVNSDGSHGNQGRSGTDGPTGVSASKQPRWVCFAKSVSPSHIMLTFIPASYGDLCVLQGQCDLEESCLPGQSELNSSKDETGKEKGRMASGGRSRFVKSDSREGLVGLRSRPVSGESDKSPSEIKLQSDLSRGKVGTSEKVRSPSGVEKAPSRVPSSLDKGKSPLADIKHSSLNRTRSSSGDKSDHQSIDALRERTRSSSGEKVVDLGGVRSDTALGEVIRRRQHSGEQAKPGMSDTRRGGTGAAEAPVTEKVLSPLLKELSSKGDKQRSPTSPAAPVSPTEYKQEIKLAEAGSDSQIKEKVSDSSSPKQDEDGKPLGDGEKCGADEGGKRELPEQNSAPPEYSNMKIPIYVYNCPLNMVREQLVNKWTYKRPADIFLDFTFDSAEELTKLDQLKIPGDDDELRVPSPELGRSPRDRRVSVRKKLMSTSSAESSGEHSAKERLRVYKDSTSSEGAFGEQADAKKHCDAIAEKFLFAFASGVYKSLQLGFSIHSQDVETVINHICEESLPIEVDVTQFLQCICGHTSRFLEKLKLEQMTQEDIQQTMPSTRILPVDPEDQNQSREEQDSRSQALTSPPVNLAIKQNLRFPMQSLTFECEITTPGLHKAIQTKFLDVVRSWFKPIQGAPEYFFFCPSSTQQGDIPQEPQDVQGELDEAPTNKLDETAEDDVFILTALSKKELEKESSRHDPKISLTKLSTCSDDGNTIASFFEHETDSIKLENEVFEGSKPLFVHLMCSVRAKKGTFMKSKPVETLPTCLSIIQDCLEGPEVDLNELIITLDLICLTLPGIVEEELITESKPKIERTLSHGSQISGISFETVSDDGLVVSVGEDGPAEMLSIPISNLQPEQQEAVNNCREQIEWLLRDEIASSLLHTAPVTVSTLEMVVDHVKSSVGKVTCIAEEIPLQFVYGPDQSHVYFKEYFERMDIPTHRLNKLGPYYYLYLVRTAVLGRSHQVVMVKELKSALQDLSLQQQTTMDDYKGVTPKVKQGQELTRDISLDSNPQGSPVSDPAKAGLPTLPKQDAASEKEKTIGMKQEVELTQTVTTEPTQETGKLVQNEPSGLMQKETPELIQKGAHGAEQEFYQKEPTDVTLKESTEPDQKVTRGSVQKEETELTQKETTELVQRGKTEVVHKSDTELTQKGKTELVQKDITEMRPKGKTELVQKDTTELTQKGEAELVQKDTTEMSPIERTEMVQKENTDVSPKGKTEVAENESTVAIQHDEAVDKEVPEKVQAVTTEAVQKESDPVPEVGIDAASELQVESVTLGEDIKISVTRPSPVKENPASTTSMSESAYQGDESDSSDTEDRGWKQKKSPGFQGHTKGAQPSKGDTKKPGLDNTHKHRRRRLRRSKTEEGSPLEVEEDLQAHENADPANTVSSPPLQPGAVSDGIVSPLAMGVVLSPPVAALLPGQTDFDKDPTLRRVYSSSSFEKYKSQEKITGGLQKGTSLPQTPTWSGRTTPQRHLSGINTPMRSRHQSGLQTPMSLAETVSSRSSYGEEAYEGDCSNDEDGPMYSLNESTVQQPILPNFWLIMRIHQDHVDCYFHTRDTGNQMETEEFIQQKQLYGKVVTKIKNLCTQVNQKLLLENLYETRMCEQLLVPEADEDVRWTRHDRGFTGIQTKKIDDSDESDEDSKSGQYLADALQHQPGHFACECVKQVEFNLHPRLWLGQDGRSGMFRGVQALRTVLNPFSVNNRQNMFVIRDNLTNANFYLRLEESVSELKAQASTTSLESSSKKQDGEENSLSVSRSSSVWSVVTGKKNLEQDDESVGFSSPRRLSMADRDPDEVKVSSSTSGRRVEEKIVLSFHGICPVGEKFSSEFLKLLQKKLDDAVLEIITFMLLRNPMCKLTAEDVEFIQRPGPPQKTLRLNIPGTAMLQQFALGYYLRQHLLQWSHTPKFSENKGEGMFQDYSRDYPVPLPENDMFLYNRTKQTGGKGLACIHLSFVDGKGNPIQLISTPKPSPFAYKDTFDKHMFEGMVVVSEYDIVPSTKIPGPAAVVQFQIWERGDVDMKQLTDKLIAAMKHAVCDIVMEYRLLTAPLCEPPEHYARGTDSPLHSAPPSPVPTTIQDPRTLLESLLPSRKTDSAGKTPKERRFFFRDDSERQKPKVTSDVSKDIPKQMAEAESAHGIPPTWQDLESQRRLELELKEKVYKYESGERGTLQAVFTGVLKNWLDFCCEQGVASVHRFGCSLLSNFSVDYVLSELKTMVSNAAPDVSVKLFKQMPSSNSNLDIVYSPYMPHRSTKTQESRGESTLDFSPCSRNFSPGKVSQFLCVGRNVQQWRACIDYFETEDDETTAPPSASIKFSKNYQKFAPLEPSSQPDRPSDLRSSPTLEVMQPLSAAFVPRQRLLLMYVQDKKFTVYMYNWANDAANSLERTFTRLTQWHNARSQLLNSIISQKMGLFQHRRFRDAAKETSQDTSLFPNSISDLENLVKFTTPPLKDLQMRARTSSIVRHTPNMPLGIPKIDQLYRNRKPTNPMHCCPKFASMRDPVHRHGMQFIELMKKEQTEAKRRKRLQELYFKWQQKMGPAKLPITEEDLDMLRHSSRLIHTVASPMLFSAIWRQHMRKIDKPTPAEAQPHQDTKSRSRHGSGASIKSRKSDDSKKKIVEPSSTPKQLPEEPWHVDLRANFLQQYTHYLQSVLTFVPVQVRSQSPKKRTMRDALEQQDGGTRGYMYLQKTLPGGIMLIELGFREVYFCVRVYVLECSCLPLRHSINKSLAVIFTDECDRLKDLTHVHSFSHDFHLHKIQAYIMDKPVFRTGYHLTSFLQDFLRHYPSSPGFSRNYITEGRVSFSGAGSTSYQLFDYMLNHEKMYGMRALRMVPLVEGDLDVCDQLTQPWPRMEAFKRSFSAAAGISWEESPPQEADYALVSRVLRADVDTEACLNRDDYWVGLVISPDNTDIAAECDRILRIKYYVIVTSKKEIYPNLKLERKLGILQSTQASKALSATHMFPYESFEIGNYEYFFGNPEARNTSKENINYLGFSNIHQCQIYKLLQKESERARNKIEDIVERTISLCQRDVLWQRMLEASQPVERRRKHKSGHEESRDLLNTRLTFSEFQQLLEIVTKVPLSEMDPTLMHLESMHLSWYHGLAKVLRSKFYEMQHRYFASADCCIEYVVVPNPKHLDMFMMLGLDQIAKRAELCAVFRDQMIDEVHTPSNPSLPAVAVQSHFESFVNTVAYHMWTGLM